MSLNGKQGGGRNDGKSRDMHYGGARFYLFFLLYLRQSFRHKFSLVCSPLSKSFVNPINVRREQFQSSHHYGNETIGRWYRP